MKKKSVLFLCMMMIMNLVACGTGEGSSGNGGSSEMNQMRQEVLKVKADADISNEEKLLIDFSTGLFARNMEEENPFLSPMSAYFALSMVGCGAQGETKSQFDKLMGKQHAVASAILMDELTGKDTKDFQLSIANSIWADKSMKVDKNYSKLMQDVYSSEIRSAELNTTKTMEDINQWCKKNTRDMIPELLKRPLSDDCKMAILNAVYMKAGWEEKFDKEDTNPMEFYREDGQVVMADMMTAYNSDRKYFYTQYANGVLLEYKDCDLAMMAVKPNKGKTVRECFEEFRKEDFKEIVDKACSKKMHLYFPKFELEFEANLTEMTKEMGLDLAFDSELAELGGIGRTDREESLYISDIFQKTKIIVDEEGTEAAAVTAILMDAMPTSVESHGPMVMKFDRPFLYMIVHEPTGTPLFIGIMDDPTKGV